MSSLGLEWKGDLVRMLNAEGLEQPLGDVETPGETILEVADMIAEALARSARRIP